jgi:hypothetical protein
LIGGGYKGKLPHFEISVKWRIFFNTHIDLSATKILDLSEFFSVLGPKTHFRVGRHENKEKRFFYFCLRIHLPISCYQLKIEKKSTPPTVQYDMEKIQKLACKSKDVYADTYTAIRISKTSAYFYRPLSNT